MYTRKEIIWLGVSATALAGLVFSSKENRKNLEKNIDEAKDKIENVRLNIVGADTVNIVLKSVETGEKIKTTLDLDYITEERVYDYKVISSHNLKLGLYVVDFIQVDKKLSDINASKAKAYCGFIETDTLKVYTEKNGASEDTIAQIKNIALDPTTLEEDFATYYTNDGR
ncbi:MAG: hypothetical protein JXR30_02270 [Alphaproteobacteria bacterium]|nr:hypothetical protein [Alphaproteobacteria bacterium]